MIVQQARSVFAHKEGGTYYQQHGIRCQEEDSAKHIFFVTRISKTNIMISIFSAFLVSCCLTGCSDQVILPSADQLKEFENTGPPYSVLDIEPPVKVKTDELIYLVTPGEVLEIIMPAILQAVSDIDADWAENLIPMLCRVDEKGAINLPLVGYIDVAGKTLAQTEAAVIKAYYPKHAVIRPSVFVRVVEYKTAKISISGAVRHPGIYSLRSDEVSLFTLLMKAGGIVDEGADLIRVLRDNEDVVTDRGNLPRQFPKRQGQKISTANLEGGSWMDLSSARRIDSTRHGNNAATNEVLRRTRHEIPYMWQGQKTREEALSGKRDSVKSFVVPVSGLNIPTVDIRLRDGDNVVVEPRKVLLFTVLGLVNAPGSFPYPANVKYNLMQAIGLAGGLNQVAEPRYATVYRLKPDGTIISAICQVVNTGDGSMLTEALNTRIKPGDIVAVEHTPRTHTKVFLDGIFGLNFGAFYRLEEASSE